MAKTKKEYIQEDEAAQNENSATKRLAESLKENKEFHFNNLEEISFKVSTGSLILDVATKGINPSLLRLCGANNEGKSPAALELMRNYLKTVPNSRGLFVLAEGRLSEENRERCGLEFVTDAELWKTGNV